MVNPSKDPCVRCAYGQTTAITFIFWINALPFPLCWPIFIFSSPELKLSKFCLSFTPDAAPALEITHHHASAFTFASLHPFFPLLGEKGGWRCADEPYAPVVWGQRQEENEESRLGSVTISLHCAVFSRSGLFAADSQRRVAASKHFFHSWLSSARQLGPLTVNLPARCEGHTWASPPLPSYCQAAANSVKTLPEDILCQSVPTHLMSTEIKTVVTTPHHRAIHNSFTNYLGRNTSWRENCYCC